MKNKFICLFINKVLGNITPTSFFFGPILTGDFALTGPIAYYVSGVAGVGWVGGGGDNFLRGLILGGQLFRKCIKCEGGSK